MPLSQNEVRRGHRMSTQSDSSCNSARFYFRDTFWFFISVFQTGPWKEAGPWVGACPYTPGGSRASCGQQENFFLVAKVQEVATSETNESIRTATEAIRESA